MNVTETSDAITAQFNNRKLLNDQTLEQTGELLFRLADRLQKRKLVLDFAQVEYLQSSVLGKLVTLSKKVAAAGGRLVVKNVHPKVHAVFTLTKLDQVFELENIQTDDTEKAT